MNCTYINFWRFTKTQSPSAAIPLKGNRARKQCRQKSPLRSESQIRFIFTTNAWNTFVESQKWKKLTSQGCVPFL